jgi:hypothetical protein
MFESIKGALADSNNSSQSNYTEILQCKPGNVYTVRLLPYTKSPKDTFYHYYNMGWVSFATGQYVQALSPQTYGERDPIAEERFRASRTGSEEDKEKAQAIKRMEKWLVNVYVVEDPTNPENNGKVKMLRYGKQLHKIITEAIEGEDAEEFGPRVFDLGSDGVNFKIKVEQQGDYPTYVSSRFTTAGKLDLSDDEQEKIYKGVFDLSQVFPLKSYDDLKQMLDEHYHCQVSEPDAPTPVATATPSPAVESVETPEPVAASAPSTSVDDDIDELLKDL